MKLFVGLILVLSQSLAWAHQSAQLNARSMHLIDTDARALFSAMAVQPLYGRDDFGPFMVKTAQIGSGKESVSMRCEIVAGGEAAGCDLIWNTLDELKAGKTTALTDEFSQGLVSGLKLLPKGEGLSALSLSVFSLNCTQVVTPTDLPFYTSCGIRLAE